MAKKKKTRYTAQKLRRRNIRFWICYLILLVLIVLAFSAVYNYFDESLTAYEAANSDEIITKVASMFTERRFDELYEYEDQSIDCLETREDYVAYLNNLTAGKEIEYRETTARDPDVRAFMVTAGGKSFATFNLRKTGKAAEFEIIPLLGYKLKTEEYAFDSITTSILRPATYEVTIRDTDSLFINGEQLAESYAVKSGVTLFYEGHLPDTVHSPTLTTYRFTCALGEPEIKVLDENGAPYELSTTDGYRLNYEIQYCDDQMRSHDETAINCVKNIARYTTKNQDQGNVLKFMQKNSPAANSVKNMNGTWLTKADKYAFENEEVKNYVRFSDEVFCCEVSLTYNTRSKGKDNSYPVAYRLYYAKVNGEWLVYDFENI